MNRAEQLETVRREFFEATGRYVWQENLGAGGMGAVFRALDTELGEPVAIKVLLRRQGSGDDESLARFKREISLSRSIRHPNVARVHDLGIAGGHFFLTMEYVSGFTLADTLESAGLISPAETVGYLRQVALGVGAAHELGIVHRDLKPQNVMIDAQGAVAILDFGLAYRGSLAPITGIETCIGTPRYMAPEQACGEPIDARTDVYAMGVMAFELLTGEVPFSGATPWETCRLQVVEPVPAHLLSEAEVPPPLAALVLECLSKSPAGRPASGRELEARLARLPLPLLVRGREEDALPVAPKTWTLPREDVVADVRTQPVAGVAGPLEGPREVGPDEAPEAVADTHVRGRARPQRPVVLVADDDADFLAFARLVLEAEGIDTRTATTGEEALHALHCPGVDLALLDLWMPSADGLDVLRIHRSQNPENPVPVVLVSAAVSRAQIAFAVRLGALEVLSKPLTPAILAETVRKHLRGLGHVIAD